MVVSFVAIAVVLLAAFLGSLLVEKRLGRSRRAIEKPGWYLAFFAVFGPALVLVSVWVPIDHPLAYAAYGLCGGVASLVAQGLYGRRIASAPTAGAP